MSALESVHDYPFTVLAKSFDGEPGIIFIYSFEKTRQAAERTLEQLRVDVESNGSFVVPYGIEETN